MKLNLAPFLLLLALLSACGGPAAEQVTPASLPSQPPAAASARETATLSAPLPATLPATATAEASATLPATATAAPSVTSTPPVPTATPSPAPTATVLPSPTAALGPTEAPSPTPACYNTFVPIGFTPDGSRLIGFLSVMDTPGVWLQALDLRRMTAKTLLKSDQTTGAMALSPDGQMFAWALSDFSIQIIRVQDGKITATLKGHTDTVNALLFSPDSKQLYSASNDASVIVWDPKAGLKKAAFQPTFTPEKFPGQVLGMGISPEGKTLVTIPVDGVTRAWDTTTFEQVGEYPGMIAGGYSGSRAAYTPDGKYLAIELNSGPGDTTLWQTDGSRRLAIGGTMGAFDFSPDSRLLARVERDADNRYQIIIGSADGQTVYHTIPPASDALIWRIIFSPDSRTLIGIDGNLLRFWNVSDGSQQKTYTPPCQ